MSIRHASFAAAVGCALLVARPILAKETDIPCMAPEAVPAEVQQAPFLVLGEVHGTREVPAFVAGYLCAAARAGRRITLAMELPAVAQDAIDAFLASRGATGDVARFTDAALWRRPMQDGRSSAAMLELFGRIRTLRATGMDIRVVAIDGEGAPKAREALLAANLAAVLDGNAGRQVVALVGGLHAIREKGKRFDPQYESAIYLLSARKPLSLTVGTAGGSAWICRGNTPATCGEAQWDVNRITPAPAGPFSLTPASAQFDGLFYVGPTTASPPPIR